MKKKWIAAVMIAVIMLGGCSTAGGEKLPSGNSGTGGKTENTGIPGIGNREDGTGTNPSETTGTETKENEAFGEELSALGVYDGYFEEDVRKIEVSCVSGTKDAYRIDGTTLTFTEISEESVYSVSGTFAGNIVIDVGDDYAFELELTGFSLVSTQTNPVLILSGDEVTITAKKGTENYIYDMREAVDEEDDSLYSAAVYAKTDLEISGKGSLTVFSGNNNGIHTKDDLKVKNLTLMVACMDNALKGNDSVKIDGGTLTLIAAAGDGIKTKNSDVSKKGKQRGTVSIAGSQITIYAACDGIDAAYNAEIEEETTTLTIYTDRYSAYSQEVTKVEEDGYYIRFSSQNYKYSIKYIDSQTGETEWVNAEYHSTVSGGRTAYYYYSFPKKTEYDKMQFFIYSSDMEQMQEENYAAASEEMSLNTSYDTIAISNNSYGWTNYSTSATSGGFGGMGGRPGMGGMGGMQDGNTEKGDHSTKGIKADNEIIIQNGTITICSYDDALHANNDETLENGETPSGNVTIFDGVLTLYTKDDGIHADGTVTIQGGTVSVTNSYEGIEGNQVVIEGGTVSVIASDDGINGTATSGTAITIAGGEIYIYCSGDGLDSNSRTSYSGIVFAGGNTVVISTSNGDSAIDTEQGYQYTAGNVVAVMPRGGMSSEATHCKNFSSVGTTTQLSLKAGEYLTAEIGTAAATVQIPSSLSAYVILLGSSKATAKTTDTTQKVLNASGVNWSE